MAGEGWLVCLCGEAYSYGVGVGGRTKVWIFDRLPEWSRDLSPALGRDRRYRTPILAVGGVALAGTAIVGGLFLSRSSSTTVDASDALRSIDVTTIDEPGGVDGAGGQQADVTPSSVLETTTSGPDATTVPSDPAGAETSSTSLDPSATSTSSITSPTSSGSTTTSTIGTTTADSTTTTAATTTSTVPPGTDPPQTTTTTTPATTTTSSFTPMFRGWEGNLPGGGFLEQYVDESYADCYLISHPSAPVSGCNETVSKFDGEFNIWMIRNHGHLVISRWLLTPDVVTEVYLLNATGDRVDALLDFDREHWVIDTTADFGPVTLFAHHSDGVDTIPLPAPAVNADRIIITRPVVLG